MDEAHQQKEIDGWRGDPTPNVNVPNSKPKTGDRNLLDSTPECILSSSPNLQSSTLDEIGRHNSNPEANPLHSPWTFWFENSPRKESYGDFGLKRLCEVKNIKAFWGVVNNITPVPNLQERTGYHLMRGEVVPTWEGNIKGGYWSMMCRKDRTQDVWTEILLASVGEQLSETISEGDDVIGVSVRIRDREDMIQIWNKDSSLAHKATVMSKMKLLCSDLDFKEKYISCKEKMAYQQPPPPKNLQGVPYSMGPPRGSPPGFFPPFRHPMGRPPMSNFQSSYPPHSFRQPGPHPRPHSGPHPGPHSGHHPGPHPSHPGPHPGPNSSSQSQSRFWTPSPEFGSQQK